MERRPAAQLTTAEEVAEVVAEVVAEGYVRWEEVFVCSEKGRREIHYYLKREDGSSDLAIVGKEKSLRHMTYRFLLDSSSSSLTVKPKSRREVVDWLNSFVPDSPILVSPQTSDGSVDGNEGNEFDVETMKDTHLRKLGYYTKEFLWLGSPWTCKKRRKHYQSFRRNGVEISVNEFVYVLAEEDKRLVAYLDDMYEDSKGNKMVVVRWFHKIDEVGIDLPHNYNDREIFFSLCLQDLSIECIDGLATVLSAQHYEKFLNEAKHTQLEPFVCYRQYDNDDLKPFDITQLKGYWKQEILRYMFSEKKAIYDASVKKPRKKLRLSRDCKVDLQCATVKDSMATVKDSMDTIHVNGQEIARHMKADLVPQCSAVGSLVEVLSQDSGVRGCWFRATIIKSHKIRVKLRYQDIKDADNEANMLEEWVLASRIAVRDDMGIRIQGRTTIRPSQSSQNGKVSGVINVGAIVDVWWHDGWWEGIVIRKEIDDELRVYFPGEKREALFSRSDLRLSREWIGSTWKELNERPDIAATISSEVVKEGGKGKTSNEKELESNMGKDLSPRSTRDCSSNNSSSILDLSKDDFLSQLKWKSSRKRKRSNFSVQKLQPRGSNRVNSERSGLFSLKVEKDIKCKYVSDSPFLGSSVGPPLTSLVMSR